MMTENNQELARQVFHSANEMQGQELSQALDYLSSMINQVDSILQSVVSDLSRQAVTDEDAEMVIALMKVRKKLTTIVAVLKQLQEMR